MLSSPSRQLRTVFVGLSLLLILSLLAAYWWSLSINHQQMRADIARQAEIRAAQSADAMAQQMAMLAHHLDYSLQTLAREYRMQPPAVFHRLAQGMISDHPPDSIVQIAIADAQGWIRYSSLGIAPGQAPASIADREHFQVHQQAASPRLHISKPVKGRVSGRWSIQFSYPILAADQFKGVIVLSLSPNYLASLLGQLAVHPEDTALLVRDDGYYLARTSHLENVLGTTLPASRPFLQTDAALQGNYDISGQVDGTHRFYGWRKLPQFGLNLVIGLASDPILAPVEATIRTSRIRSALGSALLMLAWFWIAALFWRLENQKQTLRTVFETLPVGVMIVDSEGNITGCNTRAAELLTDGKSCLPNLDTPRLTSRLTDKDGTPVAPTDALAKTAWSGQERIDGLTLGLHPIDDEISQSRWISVNATPQTNGRKGAIVVLTDITQQMASAQFRRTLLDNSPTAIAIAGAGRQITYINRQVSRLLGHGRDAMVGQNFRMIHLDEAHYLNFGRHYAQLVRDTQLETEYPLRHQDGSIRWCTIHGTLLKLPRQETQVIWSLLDNTARHYAQEALAATSQRLAVVIDRFPAGILVADTQGRISHSNQTLATLFGQAFSPENLHGRTLAEVRSNLAPHLADTSPHTDDERTLQLSDGRTLIHETIAINTQHTPSGHLLIYQDITEYKERERLLERLATTDALTGLPNRRCFIQSCEDELQRWRRYGGECGTLVMFDLDHFKRVNDTWGHAVGDQVLVQVAGITRQLLRTTDTAGRLGGEEFMILLPSTTLAGARQLAERLRQTIADTPVEGPEDTFNITASLGITLFPAHDTDDLPQAMQRADQALYIAKSSGRNCVCEL